MKQKEGIFKGLQVLELASVLAGPSVGQFFAELGAEVIKVENPSTHGDVTRSWKLPVEDEMEDCPAYFSSVNWGKKSIALDIREARQLEVLYELVRQADVVIASYKPGDEKKLKVDYETLSGMNDRLIYGHITGYGQQTNRVGYDAIIQAEAGFMYMNGEPGGNSLKMPVALMDVLAAHQLKEGLLLALMQRMQTGKGSYVHVSLIQAAVTALVNQASNWLVAGHLPAKMGSAHPNIAPYGSLFTSSDGKSVILAVGNDKQFAALCKVLGQGELAQDKRFGDNAARVKNRHELERILAEEILSHQRDELLKALAEGHVPAGGVNNMQEVFRMPEVQSLLLGEQKGVSHLAFQAEGFSKASGLLRPPSFGEHTLEILQHKTSLNQAECREISGKV